MATILDYSDEPKFTIKSVFAQTGIRPVTLRAWERRYEVLNPHRSDNRYRLYSERDVAILRWLKNRVDNDTAISSAVQELRSMMVNGMFPDAVPGRPATLPVQRGTPPAQYARQLYQALVAHEEGRASDLLREAQALFDLNTILMQIITPAMVDIGNDWYLGRIRITTEHFASALIRGKLLTLLQAYPTRRGSAYLLVGCAPTEQHEISSLMFAVLLRSAGYRVEYLGPDIPLDDLVDYAAEQRPDMIILTASMKEAALELTRMQEKLSKLPKAPLFGYGGAAFNQVPELRKKVAGVFLGESMEQAVKELRGLLQKSRSAKS